jgi:uncharacterized protein (DUF305 family)
MKLKWTLPVLLVTLTAAEQRELSCGRDPVMRRLAEEIIVDQQSEIDATNLWLSKKH